MCVCHRVSIKGAIYCLECARPLLQQAAAQPSTESTQNHAAQVLCELRALSPIEFEHWAADRFRELGYSVETTATSGDHGVDLIVRKSVEIAIVQCKHYDYGVVGEPVVRDLYGSMHHYEANRAYLVTTGRLTQAACQWVLGKPITVWDREHLVWVMERRAQDLSRVWSTRPPADLPAIDRASGITKCSMCGSSFRLDRAAWQNNLCFCPECVTSHSPFQPTTKSALLPTRSAPSPVSPRSQPTLSSPGFPSWLSSPSKPTSAIRPTPKPIPQENCSVCREIVPPDQARRREGQVLCPKCHKSLLDRQLADLADRKCPGCRSGGYVCNTCKRHVCRKHAVWIGGSCYCPTCEKQWQERRRT